MHVMAQLAALCATAAFGIGIAHAQQAAPGPMGGPGAGGMGMGHGMMGGGPGLRQGFADPAGYLAALKTNLGITPAQEPAWKDYADVVQGVAMQMQGAHAIMYDAMGTATWQERRDMMNRMFASREQAYAMVHDAAQKLLPSLTPAQRSRATGCLPGLRARGPGMMRHMSPPPGSSTT